MSLDDRIMYAISKVPEGYWYTVRHSGHYDAVLYLRTSRKGLEGCFESAFAIEDGEDDGAIDGKLAMTVESIEDKIVNKVMSILESMFLFCDESRREELENRAFFILEELLGEERISQLAPECD